jgi:AcrR family transcriptional regulator
MTDSPLLRERHQPRQDRSAQRVSLILDTTATLIDEVGYGNLTPTLIARRANMSGPAIYRYFSDLESIVLALATRNLERYVESCRRFLAHTSEWQVAIGAAVAAYADLFRHEPGFRHIRLGDAIKHEPLADRASNKTQLAGIVAALFVEVYDVTPRTHLLKHVEVMVEIGECLIAKAFEVEPDGDSFFLDECSQMMVDYITEYLARPIS